MIAVTGLFLLGIVLLLYSASVFVRKAESISGLMGISPLIIGTTIIAIGTSLPELAVSSVAALRGDSGLAFGNIVGSNITNVLLVFAVGILAGKLRIGTQKTQRTMTMLLIVTGLFLLLYLFGLPSRISGIILMGMAVFMTVLEIFWASRKPEKGQRKIKSDRQAIRGGVLSMIGAVGGIVGGGIMTVYSVELLSVRTGINTTILGMSLTAVVTSLPELFATIISEKDNEEKMTIGGILGSNIYNLALISGIALMVTSWPEFQTMEIVGLLAATGIFSATIHAYRGRVIPKTIGVFLLVLFIGYLCFEFML